MTKLFVIDNINMQNLLRLDSCIVLNDDSRKAKKKAKEKDGRNLMKNR